MVGCFGTGTGSGCVGTGTGTGCVGTGTGTGTGGTDPAEDGESSSQSPCLSRRDSDAKRYSVTATAAIAATLAAAQAAAISKPLAAAADVTALAET